MSDEILLSVTASKVRRAVAAAAVAIVGLLFLQFGISGQAGLVGSAIALALGALALWASFLCWTWTDRTLLLTRDGIREEGGAIIVPLDQISGVDRGALAFKPSGGFVLFLKSRQERAWLPGFWWRFGKRFGVGGFLPAWQMRLMADIISEEALGAPKSK